MLLSISCITASDSACILCTTCKSNKHFISKVIQCANAPLPSHFYERVGWSSLLYELFFMLHLGYLSSCVPHKNLDIRQLNV